MLSRLTKIIVACIGLFIFGSFIIGLTYSISSGFAGFMGGLPVWIIILFVLSLALYDFWEEAIKKKSDKPTPPQD